MISVSASSHALILRYAELKGISIKDAVTELLGFGLLMEFGGKPVKQKPVKETNEDKNCENHK